MVARHTADLGEYQDVVEAALAGLEEERVVERTWAGDHTVWGPEPEEIANRLGWLKSPQVMREELSGIRELVEDVRSEGYTQALLLGMGGSSLAPEVYRNVFGVADGYLDLAVLDSTDPGAILEHADRLDLSRTLFVVSTKSGGTVETFSFFKYFYNRVADVIGEDRASEHFVAITDPGSGLQDTAKKYQFRATFLNDPNIGGRYSGLSFYGLVPAALIGVDLSRLLDGAADMARACGESGVENPGAWLGAAMGELANSVGRDKLTLAGSPTFDPLGVWIEQLVAESTGKDGKGILPVEGEPLGTPEVYGDDRLFVYTGADGSDGETSATLEGLARAEHPVVQIEARKPYDLGGEMFRWMMATAVAGHILGINPFDQPNVESAKVLAGKMVAEYQEQGNLPKLEPTLQVEGITVYSSGEAKTAEEALEEFLSQARPGDYVSLQAYVKPSEETTGSLQELRLRLRDRLWVATTVGYGPRFLHSTGQLHKGDTGNGLFIQFTADHPRDAPIPDEAGADESSLTFGVLEAAQALGDRQALLDAGRRVIRFHLEEDVPGNLNRLASGL
ncbi:MAG: transaldolase / glucose-6-phosphate isomerase [Rubrobacteraceae bacterium]|nr:transaldolase / glucose-6-phosphate isomerase [Rubrobacteraceae bacterium]